MEISIGDIVLIVISAFGGAAANSWYRGQEAKVQQDRERRGLLRLISTEIIFNKATLRQLLERVSDNTAAPMDADMTDKIVGVIRTETWDKVMDRLAQWLEDEDLKLLTDYYGRIRLFRFYYTHPILGAENALSPKSGPRMKELIAESDNALNVARKYTSSGVYQPDYQRAIQRATQQLFGG